MLFGKKPKSLKQTVDEWMQNHDNIEKLEELNNQLSAFSLQVTGRIRQLVGEQTRLPGISSFDNRDKLEISILQDKTPWTTIELKKCAIPMMLYPEELNYYQYIGRFYSGSGSVVELGPWLGGSTCNILHGLLPNPHFNGKKLYVYDDFVWRASWMNPCVPQHEHLPDNQDFQFLFEKYTKNFQEHLIVAKMKINAEALNKDIPQLVWSGGPVEILYTDCGRSFEANDAWYRIFSPYFIPNKTLIIMQDWGTHRDIPKKWYNQTTQFIESRGQELSMVHELKNGQIATFIYRGGGEHK